MVNRAITVKVMKSGKRHKHEQESWLHQFYIGYYSLPDI
jgi:hypothetical protein